MSKVTGAQGGSASARPRVPAAPPTQPLAPARAALTAGASPCSYGMNSSWMAIPNCMKISGHSCDLTYYTLDPALRYYARVRAVSGNHTSLWRRTNAFSPREGRLGACPVAGGRRLRGQGAKLLGKNFGREESGDVSLHPFPEGSRAAGREGTNLGRDGTNLGRAAPAAGRSRSSVRCCKGS